MTATTQATAQSFATVADLERAPIPDLVIHRLTAHVDDRGSLFEIFSDAWGVMAMRQWTAMTLGKGVVRGPSVHRRHTDAVITLTGELQIGLRDLREQSPVFGQAFRLTFSPREPKLLLIPPGVMHAFYAATEPTLVMVGSSHSYDPDDDIKCRWQDVALELDPSVIGAHDDRALPLDFVIALLRG
jgi:dTDP-4-dehydrorhamnose 3,5-epimerase